jgi:hypothetical protein
MKVIGTVKHRNQKYDWVKTGDEKGKDSKWKGEREHE